MHSDFNLFTLQYAMAWLFYMGLCPLHLHLEQGINNRKHKIQPPWKITEENNIDL